MLQFVFSPFLLLHFKWNTVASPSLIHNREKVRAHHVQPQTLKVPITVKNSQIFNILLKFNFFFLSLSVYLILILRPLHLSSLSLCLASELFFLEVAENVCNFHILFWKLLPFFPAAWFPISSSYSLSYFFWFLAHFTCSLFLLLTLHCFPLSFNLPVVLFAEEGFRGGRKDAAVLFFSTLCSVFYFLTCVSSPPSCVCGLSS